MIGSTAMKKQKNRYAKSSKLSEAKFRLLVKLFAADLTAVQIAQLSSVNRNTVNRYLRLIRERLLHLKETEFRYNLRHQNIGRVILRICREKPLS